MGAAAGLIASRTVHSFCLDDDPRAVRRMRRMRPPDSPPMSTPARVAIAIFVVVVESAAGWALTTPERQCQQALARGGRQFLKRSMAALAACRRGIARGTLPAGTDCRGEATASGTRAAAAARLAQSIGQACSPAAAAALYLGGDCAGAHTIDDLTGCIQDGHDADATTLIGAADATDGALAANVRHCQDEASGQVRAFTSARLAALQQCKRHPPKDLAPGSDCTAATSTAARIAARRATAGNK